MTHLRTRYLATYADGFRLGRRFYRVYLGRARGRAVGLGFVVAREPWTTLTVTLGPWAIGVDASSRYADRLSYGEIMEMEARRP